MLSDGRELYVSHGNGFVGGFVKEHLSFGATYEMFTDKVMNVRSAAKCHRGREGGGKERP